MVFWLAGCATAPKPVPIQLPGEMSAQALCRKYNIECRWEGVAQGLTMLYMDKKIRAMVGSNIVLVNKNRIVLSAPLYRKRGVVMLPSDFEKQVFGTLSLPQEEYFKGVQAGRLKKVVIDAGHGGKDSGAVGVWGLKEKDIILDIARRLEKDFQAAGVEVVMTRDQDEFISLAERTALASRPDIDLYLSIHANANKKRIANGIEVYYSAALTKDDLTEDQRAANEKKICGLFNMRRDIPELKDIVTGMLYSYKRARSQELSDIISDGLMNETPRQSRGSKSARFFVLRNTLVPAVLIEVGFITNPKEAKLLKDGAYRQRLADSIAKSTLKYVYVSGL